MKKRKVTTWSCTNILFGFILIFLAIALYDDGIRNNFRASGLFILSFIKNPKTVGAIWPSSKKLAKTITKKVKRGKENIKVLEVGAGTGVFTEELVSKLGENDTLDVIEIDKKFCLHLKKKFADKKNINIHCISILDWNPEYSYDYIISGLPFNAFDSDFLKKILNKYKNLISESGIISYFEYIALAKVKLFFLNKKEKTEYSKTITTTADFRSKFRKKEREAIIANLPPAYVYHLYSE